MAKKLSTADLVKEMNGRDTLNGWDVLVSYDEDSINKLLSVRAEALTTLSKVDPWSLEVKDDWDGTVKFDYNVVISKPKIQFTGTKSRIMLSFGLTGSVAKNGKARDLPPNLVLNIETDLRNVTGTLSDKATPSTADFVPATDAASTMADANHVVLMRPEAGAAQGVCIDLASDSLGVEILATDNPGALLPDAVTKMSEGLKAHLRSHGGLKMYIAALSNVYSAAHGSSLLKPQAFAFTCIGGDKGVPGTLCMWAGVEGGANGGKWASARQDLSFHPDQFNVHSIPLESTASVIFSHQLMASYFIAALKEKGTYDGLYASSGPGTTGIIINGKCNKQITKDMSSYSGTSFKWTLSVETVRYGNLNFNMHDKETTFHFGKPQSSSAVTVDYDSGVVQTSWFLTSVSLGNSRVDSKTIRMRFTHGGSAAWQDGRLETNPNLLKLKFTMPTKFTVKDKDATGKFLFWDVEHVDLPEPYKNVDVDLPTMNFDLKGLDYFLTTNLVLPGARLFIADDPTSKSGDAHGLFVPRDTLLTGKIATELKAVQ
ncbi:hypothetical protein MMC26_001112 [Xylographa opegraphella]|nr:hypothetical protein [Xylographa opegraphella]